MIFVSPLQGSRCGLFPSPRAPALGLHMCPLQGQSLFPEVPDAQRFHFSLTHLPGPSLLWDGIGLGWFAALSIWATCPLGLGLTFALRTSHFTLRTSHFTLHTSHFTLLEFSGSQGPNVRTLLLGKRHLPFDTCHLSFVMATRLPQACVARPVTLGFKNHSPS